MEHMMEPNSSHIYSVQWQPPQLSNARVIHLASVQNYNTGQNSVSFLPEYSGCYWHERKQVDKTKHLGKIDLFYHCRRIL